MCKTTKPSKLEIKTNNNSKGVFIKVFEIRGYSPRLARP